MSYLKSNRKVKNATKVEFDGRLFDSKLEVKFAQLLKESGIKFYRYNEVSIEIMPKFVYNGETIRAAKYKPDFIVGPYCIEVKGYPTDAWKVRRKIILNYMSNHAEYKYREVKSVAEMKALITELKNETI